MLDVYIDGVVKRISPEAPVPVLNTVSEKRMVGGAANVARNIAALGGMGLLFSVVGQDETADMIVDDLAHASIAHSFIYEHPRSTTRKTRYEAHGQQILRVDEECTNDILDASKDTLIRHMGHHLDDCRVMVLSDYAKGVLTHEVCVALISEAKERGITTVVDPKHKNLSRYRGATIIKPNADELAAATGMKTDTKEECLAAAACVRDNFEIPNVLVTRGHRGMLMITPDDFYEEPGYPREVANVVGAGDTALAALSVGISKQWPLKKAMEFANMAAAIAVGKHGTAAVTRQEVYDAFSRA